MQVAMFCHSLFVDAAAWLTMARENIKTLGETAAAAATTPAEGH